MVKPTKEELDLIILVEFDNAFDALNSESNISETEAFFMFEQGMRLVINYVNKAYDNRK